MKRDHVWPPMAKRFKYFLIISTPLLNDFFSFFFFLLSLSSPFFFIYMMPQDKEEIAPSRRLSLPDITKLKEEWDRREAIQATAQLSPGKLQVKKSSFSVFLNKNIELT